MRRSIDDILKIDELRAGFLRYTREAYARIPPLARPRILDIGCGNGLPTIELAQLSGGEVIAIDSDEAALARLRERTVEAKLGDRVKVINASLFDVGFADESFDILWEEGVLHLLDCARSLPACHRLLEPGGFLVMHETIAWIEATWEQIEAAGFDTVDRVLLPTRCWWTDYYATLQARIRELRENLGAAAYAAGLAQHEREIAMVEADPDRFDCGFFVVKRAG